MITANNRTEYQATTQDSTLQLNNEPALTLKCTTKDNIQLALV